MGAKVLKMEGVTQAKKTRGRKFSYYTEDPNARYLFMAEDAQGKPMYFFKMQIIGLKDRVFGPYARRSMAIDGFDTVLGGGARIVLQCAKCRPTQGGRDGAPCVAHEPQAGSDAVNA